MIAYKDLSMEEYEQCKDDMEALETNLTALNIFGLADPLKQNVPETIEKCRNAGIQVIMCTGDNAITASSIATQAGMLDHNSSFNRQNQPEMISEYTCMSGKDFREAVGGLKQINGEEVIADMHKFREIKKYLKVLARATPQDKYLLVVGLRQSGEVVAVTGDGTNDAPALKKANVGFSMGAGTDVARQASDIILLDNNFSSIVVSLIYGRNIYDCIRKFL